jgi:hypothetical protein
MYFSACLLLRINFYYIVLLTITIFNRYIFLTHRIFTLLILTRVDSIDACSEIEITIIGLSLVFIRLYSV